MQAWRIDVLARQDQLDPIGESARRSLDQAGLQGVASVRARRGYLLGSELTRAQVDAFAAAVLCDPIVETFVVHAPGAAADHPPGAHTLTIVPKPGVTDPVAHSVQKALADMDLPVVAAGTYRTYDVHGDVAKDALLQVARKGLANDTVQEILVDQLPEGLPGEPPAPDLAVHEIATLLRINLKTASEHVRRMSLAGLVNKRNVGRSVHNALTPRGEHVLTFLRMLE